MGDDVPLPGAGILRLVDQHVVDAAVELVMHPAGRHPVQHQNRLVDQIVIVEQAALLLLAPVVRRRGGCDPQQRLGAVPHRQRAAPLDQGGDAQAFLVERAGERRIAVAEFFGQQRFARRSLVGEKHAEIVFDLFAAGEHQRLAEPVRMVLFGLAARVEGAAIALPARYRQVRPVDDLALDVLDAVSGIDAERGRQLRRRGLDAAGPVGPGHEVVAAQTGLAHHVLEGDVGGAGHGDVERAAGGAVGIARGIEHHLEIGALHHLVLVALVDHGKTRGHVGLERELLQQPGAQRVDGLHLQPARRLQRAGEQFSRRHPQGCVGMRDAGVAYRRRRGPRHRA